MKNKKEEEKEEQVQLPPFKVEQSIFEKFENLRAKKKERTDKGGLPSRVEMFRRLVRRADEEE